MALPPVAVLGGTGQHGRGLACRLARAGYPVVVGSRDPLRAVRVVDEWREPCPIATASILEAVQRAAVVVLAIPFDAVDPTLRSVSPCFAHEALVVDVTVPLTFVGGVAGLARVAEGSAAEHVKARVPAHVRVAATFKTVPARLLHAADSPLDCDEFVCGDSSSARTDASALITAVSGLRAVDVGPLSRAQAIEHLTLLAVAINRRHHVHDARFRIVGL
jgi:8-hydroxy-5-deazaflavin:NADPH oxidoreductase